MSSSIDDRIVNMQFKSNKFQEGVSGTLKALEMLKKGLNLQGATKSLEELDSAGKRFSLDGVGSGVEKISGKFIALATIGITALTRIANKAITVGTQLAKSITVEPISQGFAEYELKLGSIQTIMAGTGASLDTVNGKLNELNRYADRTIYSFADMTQNIGKFTNAGVDLDTAVASIQGIANVAAVSGANANEASRAMYNFAQALSSGSVRLIDWKSIELANLATAEFKTEILESAVAAGTLTKDVDGLYKTLEGTPISATQGFNESLEQQWLTTEVLNETLGRYSDETTEIGKKAFAAAQDVKTFTQLIDTLKEASGSGWAETSEILVGNFDEAKELWTGVSEVIGGMIGASADARNALLRDWKDLGGRTVIIESISNAFNALMAVIAPIKEAFREIFPAVTGQQLYDLSLKIRDFTEKLKIGSRTADQIKRIFKGFFAILDIGRQIFTGIIGVVGTLIGELFKGSGTVLSFGAKIGDFFVNLNEAIKKGEGLTKFFDSLKQGVRNVANFIEAVTYAIGRFFSSFSSGEGEAANGVIDAFAARFEAFGSLGETLSRIWSRVWNALKQVYNFFLPFITAVKDLFVQLGQNIADAFANVEFSTVLDTINTGLFAALVVMVKKFFSRGISIPGGGFLESIKGIFNGVTDTLSAMQSQLKAGTLLKIAGAVGILTASIFVLSTIDSASLTRALGAITVMFLQLAGSLALFDKVVTGGSLAKIPAISAALLLLSTAVLILSFAVKNLAGLSWEELAKGLTGVGVALGLLVAASYGMQKAALRLSVIGLGLIALGIAVRVLASSVRAFSSLSWGELAKGLAGVAATLTALGIFAKFANLGKLGVANGAGLLLLAVSLKVLASVVGDFGAMDWGSMIKGFVGMAAALLIIAGAMQLMPATMIISAAALVVVAGALLVLNQVLKQMGGMSWEEIAKGLVTLAGSLLVIAGAMYLMTGAIAGALALIVVAGALAILAPVLIAFGGMSWGEIVRGIVMLAAALLTIGVVSGVLTPLIPLMIGLGVAIALLGVGMLAAGAGLLAFSLGLSALAVAGSAGTAALVGIVSALIGLIPAAAKAVAQGLVAFAEVIANSGPTFVRAMTTLLLSLITAINRVAPRIIDTLFNLIMRLVNKLKENVPKFVVAGLELITGLLNGIAKNIPKIANAATNVIVAFLRAIGRNVPRLADEGLKMVTTLVNGVANAIRRNTASMQAAGRNLASAVIDGMTGGLFSGIGRVASKAREVASNALNAAKRFLGIGSPSKEFHQVGLWSDEGLANGLTDGIRGVTKASELVGRKSLESLRKTVSVFPDVLSVGLNIEPTITPTLDLSNVQARAKDLDRLLTPTTIEPEISRTKAGLISAQSREIADALAAANFSGERVVEGAVTFVQNNTSPKALSTAEIYRNTRNQLSVVRGGLPR